MLVRSGLALPLRRMGHGVAAPLGVRGDAMGSVEEKAHERRWWILAVLCFSLLVIVLDNSILNVAIPTIIRDLGATNRQLQWMVDSYTLVFAGLLLTAGALGDRFGRRPALQVGFVIFGLGSLISAFATSANQLILTRGVMGIGGALIMPATLSIITNVFPPHERGRAIGVWAGVAGLGGALGPLTGGFLVEHFYWGSVFLVNLPIVLVGLLAGFFLIPNSKDPSGPRVDPVGAAMSIIGLTALLFAIIEAPTEGWSDPVVVATGSCGLVLLGLFVWWERRSTHPMLDVRFFANPRFSAASASITLVFFAMFGSIFLLTQYFQFVLGYTPLETGVRMLPFAMTMMVVAPTSSRIVERIGTKITVTTGLVLVTSGLLSMTMLEVDSSYPQVVWRLMLMAMGMGLTMAPATDSVMGSLPLAKAGVGSAVNDTTRQVGGALGVAVIGSVLATTYGDKVTSAMQAVGAPDEAIEAATSSLGGAAAVAARVGGETGNALLQVANQAFVDALHWGVAVAAIPTAIGAVVALLYLPARARSADAAGQDQEFLDEHRDDSDIDRIRTELDPT
ncbi:MAG: MFS transporter [Microthrixaceae bacterium]